MIHPRLFLPALMACSISLSSQSLEAREVPVPIIFDSDMTGDVNDALALAMLHSLADRGKCKILAVTLSKQHELAAPFVDALNTFYGHPDIPIGTSETAPEKDSAYLSLALEEDDGDLRYPRDIGVTQSPENAVALIRTTLENADDHSVSIIQTGLAVNLAALLDSEGGPALIRQKVAQLSVRAGAFETVGSNNRYREANVRNHISSMQTLADKWPDEVPIVWTGFTVGQSNLLPAARLIEGGSYHPKHPIVEAYLLQHGSETDTNSGDPASVLYSIFPDRSYFGVSPVGRVTVTDEGVTTFMPAQGSSDRPRDITKKPKAQKRDRYLTLAASQITRVQEAILQFVVQPPRELEITSQEAPIKLIFDTDMGNDVDDAMALAVIHSLQRRGACELLATTSTKDHPLSAAFIDAINTFYGYPDISIGVVRDGATPEVGKFNQLAAHYPHDLKSSEEAPEAVGLLRKTLAAQPDLSVTIVQVGFFTNLARLIESEPDAHSPLSGRELVVQKVKELSLMAGSFQTIRYNNGYREYNVWKDIPSAREFSEKWPTPIVWSGFEIGLAAAYPWQSVQEDFEYAKPHPIKESYLDYAPSLPHDRPTWDLTSVLYAIFPDSDYFGLSEKGLVQIEEDGFSRFTPSHLSNQTRDRFLTMDAKQTERVREALVQLCSEPPVLD